MPARCHTAFERCQGDALGIPRPRPVSTVAAASASRSAIRRRSPCALGGADWRA
jgi:hypothetical protein